MPHSNPITPHIAIILPARERFGAEAVGAVGLVVRRLAAHPAGARISVVGAPQPGPSFPGLTFVPAELPPALRLLPLGANRRYALAVALTLRRLRPDLIEVHNRADIAGWLASPWSASMGPGDTPVSLVLHNDPRAMHGARRPAERRRLLRRLACVVAVSDWLREAMLEGESDPPDRVPDRVMVIPNGLALEDIPPSPAVRDRLILFVGRITADKGADAFIAACARALPTLPGWRAEMIGADRFRADSPDTEFTRQWLPRARAANIALPGYLPHDAVLATMARAAIMVVPSRWREPFGLTALEAMACGAALACSCRGGLAELVGSACRPIDPDDPARLADMLRLLANSPAECARLGEAGRARAAVFDAVVVAERYAALRRDIIAAARLARAGGRAYIGSNSTQPRE